MSHPTPAEFKGVSEIAERYKLAFPDASFVALVVLGETAKAAYQRTRPSVKPESARTAGGRLGRRLQPIIDELRIHDAIVGVSDLTLVRLMLDGNETAKIHACKEVNRAFRPKPEGEVSDLAQLLAALAQPPAAADQQIEELGRIVDLTRPEPMSQ